MEANTVWKLTLFPLQTRNTALMEQKLEHEITLKIWEFILDSIEKVEPA